MAIRVAGITMEEFDANALWVIKYNYGHRVVDTYHNLESRGYLDDDEIRDIDLLCEEGQPDIIKPFMKRMHEIDKTHGWKTIPEIFSEFGEDDGLAS